MAYQLNCPCGEMIAAVDEDFIDAVVSHLASAHPGRSYTENEIMMLAMPIPDRVVHTRGEAGAQSARGGVRHT